MSNENKILFYFCGFVQFIDSYNFSIRLCLARKVGLTLPQRKALFQVGQSFRCFKSHQLTEWSAHLETNPGDTFGQSR